MTSAKVIADSITEEGNRLTTLELRFPRHILAQLNTHCAFSRNSASNRARSVKKTIKEVEENPYIPKHFPSEKVGMSGGPDIPDAEEAKTIWMFGHINAVQTARDLAEIGVHKSVVNRLLEPFMYTTVVLTATDWDNFFKQRLAINDDGTKASELEMYDLAAKMKTALDNSDPRLVLHGDWHLPYISDEEMDFFPIERSIARCAGVSYLNQNKARNAEDELALYEKLANANPPHLSPFEHVATPGECYKRYYKLNGWKSYRYVIEEESN